MPRGPADVHMTWEAIRAGAKQAGYTERQFTFGNVWILPCRLRHDDLPFLFGPRE